MKQINRINLGVAMTLIILVAGTSTVLAQSFSKGYKTQDTGLLPGMVASLSSDATPDNLLVVRASQENPDKSIGVSTNADDNLVTVASGDQTAYIQSSGVVTAFVSDLNGSVKNGDKLAISPLRGILWRTDDLGNTIGTALEDLPLHTAETQTVKTKSGDTNTKISKIKITLDNSLSSNQAKIMDSSALKRLGRSIVGKEVSDLQVIVALIIFLTVMVAEGSIIYGSVSSSITSMGRNPLARNIIKKELVRVLVLTVIVLFVGLAAVYAVLII